MPVSGPALGLGSMSTVAAPLLRVLMLLAFDYIIACIIYPFVLWLRRLARPPEDDEEEGVQGDGEN